MLGQEKGPNSDQTGETIVAQSPRLCWAMVPPKHSLLGGGIARLGGGTAQCQTASGGTARTLKFRGI